MATTNDLKNGLVLNFDGQLWTVVEFQHVKPGKGGAFVRTKLKNVETGQVVDKTFRAGEKVGRQCWRGDKHCPGSGQDDFPLHA